MQRSLHKMCVCIGDTCKQCLGRTCMYVFLALSITVTAANAQSTDDLLLLEARVNRLKKGDVIAFVDPNQLVWLREDGFAKLALKIPEKFTIAKKEIDGKNFLSLAVPPLSVNLDLDGLILDIEAPAAWLGNYIVDFKNIGAATLSPLAPFVAYANYAWALQQIDRQSSQLSNDVQFGMGLYEWVLQTRHLFALTSGNLSSTRVRSTLIRDWPKTMARLSIGDIQPDGGGFSQSGTLLGVQWARHFEFAPDFAKNPTFEFIGEASFPSTLEISVDGQLIQTVQLKPGKFDLRNFAYFYGLRNVQLTLTDSLGQRTTFTRPFYFSDQTLRSGVHSYSYALGVLRKDISASGNPVYGGLVANGIHQYGLTNYLTTGLYADVVPGYQLVGGLLNIILGRPGVLSLKWASRKNKAQSDFPFTAIGQAWQTSYSMTMDRLNFGAAYSYQGKNFEPFTTEIVETTQAPNRNLLFLSASFGWSNKSVGVNLLRQQNWLGYQAQSTGVNYYHRLSTKLVFQMNVTQTKEGNNVSHSVGLQLNFQIGKSKTVNLQIDKKQSVQYQHNPDDTSIGFQVNANYQDGTKGLDTQGVYLHKDVILTGAARAQETAAGEKSWQGELRAFGSVTYAAESIWFNRPLGDSFAVIDVAGVPKVKVYQNNQFLGETNSHGNILAVNLAPYLIQQIHIDDGDIPLDLSLETVSKSVVSRAGTAAFVRFDIKKLSAITGRIFTEWQKQTIPVIEASLVLTDEAGAEITAITGPDGDFYIEDAGLGKNYLFTATNGLLKCTGSISGSSFKPPLTDLGVLSCQPKND